MAYELEQKIASVLDDIYLYYLNHSEQATREKMFGIEVNPMMIELDENYPYYDSGLRKVECVLGEFGKYYLSRFCVYVDLSFLNSDLFEFFNKCYDIENIVIVSKPLHLSKNSYIYSNKFSFLVDMSGIEMGPVHYCYFTYDKFIQLLESNLNLLIDDYAVSYKIDNIDITNIEKHFNNFDLCFLKNQSEYRYSGLCFNGDNSVFLNIYGDTYEHILNYLKVFISKIHTSYKVKDCMVCLYINCHVKEKGFMNTNYKNTFSSCKGNDRLDNNLDNNLDFLFLKDYVEYFDEITIRVESCGYVEKSVDN